MHIHLPARLRRKHIALGLAGTVFLVLLVIFLALEALAYGAAGIFNQVVEQQDMLRGHVRVEKLFAHINGHIRFEGLVWTDEADNPVLIVPEGDFYVIALGAGLGIWGVINLLEGYGSDNPGAKSQGMKQLMAGGGVALIGLILVPLLSGLFG